MSKKTTILTIILALSLFLMAALNFYGYEAKQQPCFFYVAINGNDNWSGTLAEPNKRGTDGPFATLNRVREAIRQLKNAGQFKKALTVMVRGGTYFISEPFILRPEDSGTEEYPITYMAYPGEKPILSAGRKIVGWQPVNNHLWQVELPEVKAGEFYFSQFFVNGERRRRARIPDESYYNVFGPAFPKNLDDDKNKIAFQYKSGDINKSWDNLEDAEVVVLQHWTEARLHIFEIDQENSLITFTGGSKRPLTWSNGYYIENIFEGLTKPGDWYLNRETGILYYWPMPDEDMTKVEAIAPAVEQLVRFEGNVDANEFVQYVVFRGFTFSYTSWALSEKGHFYDQAELDIPAAIYAEGTLHCGFENNNIAHLGGWGIELGRGSKGNRLIGNNFYDLGAGGIKVGEIINRERDIDETSSTIISDNYFYNGGQVFFGSPGIWIGQSSNNTVSHNEISGSWQWGISSGWNWSYMQPNRTRDNIIEYNHLHNIGESILGTHGAIYTLGVQPGTVIRDNLIHHISGWYGAGIILDEGSNGILVEKNIVHHTVSGGQVFNWNCSGNVIQNNIFALGKESQLIRYGDAPQGQEVPNANVSQYNIVYWKEGKLHHGNSWSNFDTVYDYNLYFDASGRPINFLAFTFEEWKTKGLDLHSIIADPLFVDPEQGDFTLKPGSPALEIGFKPIEISTVGPRNN